jgi:hypothetical protein
MDEGLDSDVDSGIADSADIGANSDLPANESADISIEQLLADTPIDETEFDGLNEAEPPVAELQGEANTLEIEPSDDEIDLGYDYDEAIQAANEIAEQPPETSAASNILTSVSDGLASPSDLAQFSGEFISPPGAEDAVARGLQAGLNMGVTGSEEFMTATIRQHGIGPAAELQNLQIQQAIEAGRQPEFLNKSGED